MTQHDTKSFILALSDLSIFFRGIHIYATNLELLHNRASVMYKVTIDLKNG